MTMALTLEGRRFAVSPNLLNTFRSSFEPSESSSNGEIKEIQGLLSRVQQDNA